MKFITNFLNRFLNVPHYERIKIILLAISFFCILGCYSVFRELRDTLFVHIVGCDYIQYAQLAAMVLLIPYLLVFSYLVDRLKKHQLLFFYSIAYGIGGLVIAYCVGHPTIGIANTQIGSHRLFGWMLYFFVEGYYPFVMSLFLSYVNSVTPPSTVPQSYSFIVAGSKLGGMGISLFAWWFLGYSRFSAGVTLQILLIIASGLVLLVPFVIGFLMKKVPEKHMHGYEASYIADQKEDLKDKEEKKSWYESILSGLIFIFKNPYALGIFGLVLYWDVINVVIGFQRLKTCISLYKPILQLGSVLFLQNFWVHCAGFFIALIGARILLAYIGERYTLVAVPLVTGVLLAGYFLGGIIPNPDKYIIPIAFLIIILSFFPIIIKMIKYKFGRVEGK